MYRVYIRKARYRRGKMEYIIASGIFVIIMWQVIKKAGYRHPEISLLMLVPFVNIGLLFWIAFSSWPIQRVIATLLQTIEGSDRIK